MIGSLFCHHIETPFRAEIDELLNDAGIAQRKKSKARAILLKERIGKK
jgi:hypothetical protein